MSKSNLSLCVQNRSACSSPLSTNKKSALNSLEHAVYFQSFSWFKGIRYHTVTGAPNCHQVWVCCIRKVCVSLNLKGNVASVPRSTTNRHWHPMFERRKKITGYFFLQTNDHNSQPSVNSVRTVSCDTQHLGNMSYICSVINCAYWLSECSLLPSQG